ncbi:3-oxoacyl-ACP synthase [Catellatospora sp. TT07R-123]|uniref:3-oxoacyl-[acyl-carrier-protein] synthase III C-terminal domain-containing protein n=1 Tax=Catellatospora sp. TT07R-123 TaxID=2733863 RepID=UPI001B2A5FE1|nr:3-oxoacyl-[acyl-carrier-protein] synthase III C-terminal domain-containing protein [Catellatospora sp. TT07R-123]GHJ43211.1 3-oxoacyl-ACP synthase [Catellatospora sp. TT07R-123]
MASPSLLAVAAYLPEHTVAVADLPELRDLPPEQRDTCLRLGVSHVPCDPALSTTDLAERAAQRALAQAGLSGSDIDALIVVESRAPEHLVSSEATRLQHRLDLTRAMSFTVGGLGCVSITPALLTARGLLAADPDLSTVLIAHGSRPATPHRYRHPVTISGDGGLAVIVARHGPVRVRDIVLETNGAYWDLFRVDYRDLPTAQWREQCADLAAYSFSLAVETAGRLRALNRLALRRSGLDQRDIACYLSQNLSLSTFQVYAELLDAAIAPACADNLSRYGHQGPNDIMLNLSHAIERGELPEGGTAIAVNASPSAAWSMLILEHGATAGTDVHYL